MVHGTRALTALNGEVFAVAMTEFLSHELCLHRVESIARLAHLGLKFLHRVELVCSPCSLGFEVLA